MGGTEEGVALDEPQVPSPATRERWQDHFGSGSEGAGRPPSRLPAFSRQGAAPRLDLQACLKAFGFETRAEAEELGKRAVQARAEAHARNSRAECAAEAGELD